MKSETLNLVSGNILLADSISTMSLLIGGLVGAIVAAIIVYVMMKSATKRKADGIIKDAEREAETIKEKKILAAKEKFLNLKEEHEKVIKERNKKLQASQDRTKSKENGLNKKMSDFDRKHKEVDRKTEQVQKQLNALQKKEDELTLVHQKHVARARDLDLITYGQEEIKTLGLEVPHPRMAERLFVLLPLAEIRPQFILPGRRVKLDVLIEEAPPMEISQLPQAPLLP